MPRILKAFSVKVLRRYGSLSLFRLNERTIKRMRVASGDNKRRVHRQFSSRWRSCWRRYANYVAAGGKFNIRQFVRVCSRRIIRQTASPEDDDWKPGSRFHRSCTLKRSLKRSVRIAKRATASIPTRNTISLDSALKRFSKLGYPLGFVA